MSRLRCTTAGIDGSPKDVGHGAIAYRGAVVHGIKAVFVVLQWCDKRGRLLFTRGRRHNLRSG